VASRPTASPLDNLDEMDFSRMSLDLKDTKGFRMQNRMRNSKNKFDFTTKQQTSGI